MSIDHAISVFTRKKTPPGSVNEILSVTSDKHHPPTRPKQKAKSKPKTELPTQTKVSPVERRPLWWAIWRSVLDEKGNLLIADISDSLAIFGNFHVEKICDYSDFPSGQRPSFSNWLTIYRGRIGMETFIIYLGKQDRWIAVCGQQYMDLEESTKPQPIARGKRNRAKIDRVYRVNDATEQSYSVGHQDGYELGKSHSWKEAQDTAVKKVWKEAYAEGRKEVLGGSKKYIPYKLAKAITLSGFALGVLATTIFSLF